jgi:hypothetical protein
MPSASVAGKKSGKIVRREIFNLEALMPGSFLRESAGRRGLRTDRTRRITGRKRRHARGVFGSNAVARAAAAGHLIETRSGRMVPESGSHPCAAFESDVSRAAEQ